MEMGNAMRIEQTTPEMAAMTVSRKKELVIWKTKLFLMQMILVQIKLFLPTIMAVMANMMIKASIVSALNYSKNS